MPSGHRWRAVSVAFKTPDGVVVRTPGALEYAPRAPRQRQVHEKGDAMARGRKNPQIPARGSTVISAVRVPHQSHLRVAVNKLPTHLRRAIAGPILDPMCRSTSANGSTHLERKRLAKDRSCPASLAPRKASTAIDHTPRLSSHLGCASMPIGMSARVW